MKDKIKYGTEIRYKDYSLTVEKKSDFGIYCLNSLNQRLYIGFKTLFEDFRLGKCHF